MATVTGLTLWLPLSETNRNAPNTARPVGLSNRTSSDEADDTSPEDVSVLGPVTKSTFVTTLLSTVRRLILWLPESAT